MPLEHAPIQLDTLAEGAALDHFEAGLRKILQDVDDPAKRAEAKRSFCLKFTLTPGENHLSSKFECELTRVTLAPSRVAVTSGYLSRVGGQLELLEVQQTELPVPDNVTSINQEE